MIRDIPKRELLSLFEIVDKWARCSSSASFEDTIKSLPSLLPYEVSLCAIGNANSLTINKLINNKFPLDYLQHYFTKRMIQNDPFVSKTLVSEKPHFWNVENYKDKSEYKRFVMFNKDFGLNLGLSSAFSESNGKVTFLCLSKPLENPRKHHLQIVNFIMPHLHITFNRLYNLGNGNCNSHSLSNKELEVLKWIKEGKTNWEISKIINISEATVKFHIANVLKKLDAVNRGHAVAMALQTGILSL